MHHITSEEDGPQKMVGTIEIHTYHVKSPHVILVNKVSMTSIKVLD